MSEKLMDTEEAKRQGYHVTPGGQQWSTAPRKPVDKSRWKPCHACSRLIPVVEVRGDRIVEVRTASQRPSDPDSTVIEEGLSRLVESVEPAATWSYVCPFCGHGQVGTPGDSPDSQAKAACHECGAELGDSFQCRECSFPRGWMTVQCRYCGARQAVHAPHWVDHCDLFTLECVKCESRFDSPCIC
jgi:transcription elongation factor Elf1